MPRIKSASPDFKSLEGPSPEYNYVHGAEVRRGFIPMAFQVTSPFDFRRALLPHALVMHVNPANLSENFSKKIEKIQTRGGWVEQHWFDELTEMSADGSTGAFVNLYTGLTSVLRQRTIAWDRFRDLYDLFHNNGSVYDPYGAIVLQGQILLLYDRGVYVGTFRSFDVEETEESPFAFRVSWTFKVEETILKMPNMLEQASRVGNIFPHPSIQDSNTIPIQYSEGAALSYEDAYSKGLTQSANEAVAKSKKETAAIEASYNKSAPSPEPKVSPMRMAPSNPNRSGSSGGNGPVAVPTTPPISDQTNYGIRFDKEGNVTDAHGNRLPNLNAG